MKAVVAAFNQEKALVGAFSVITNHRMQLFEALEQAGLHRQLPGDGAAVPRPRRQPQHGPRPGLGAPRSLRPRPPLPPLQPPAGRPRLPPRRAPRRQPPEVRGRGGGDGGGGGEDLAAGHPPLPAQLLAAVSRHAHLLRLHLPVRVAGAELLQDRVQLRGGGRQLPRGSRLPRVRRGLARARLAARPHRPPGGHINLHARC